MNSIRISAPFSGFTVPLTAVPDQVFSKGLAGPGLAIDPTDVVVRSPIAGTIVQLHRAGHAVGVRSEHGFTVLIHVGIDTVKLNGKGFRAHVEVGQLVQRGQPLIEFDLETIAEQVPTLLSPVLILDLPEGARLHAVSPSRVRADQDAIMDIEIPVAHEQSSGTRSAQSVTSLKGVEHHWPTPEGLHARPAALIAHCAKPYVGEVWLCAKGQRINAKSVMNLLTSGVVAGDQVQFELASSGVHQDEAAQKMLTALDDLIKSMVPHGAEAPKTSIEQPQHHPQRQEVSKQTPINLPDQHLIMGVCASPGIAVGPLFQWRAQKFEFALTGADPQKETARLRQGLADAEADLKRFIDRQQKNSQSADIFRAHCELLADPELFKSARQFLDLGASAEAAWDKATAQSAEQLAAMKNELLAHRAQDLRDIGARVLEKLSGGKVTASQLPPPGSLVVAENLTPSETAHLAESRPSGFCTVGGGATSHVAILARSLNLPALVACGPEILSWQNGEIVALDAIAGSLQRNLTEAALKNIENLQLQNRAEFQRALAVAAEPAILIGGPRIDVAANIASAAEAESAVRNGADGVGLLRTEFLFLDRDDPPSEEEQFQVYQKISDILGERFFTLRTLDIGGDKPVPYVYSTKEENPFLGIRGIRLSLLSQDVFKTQLRAIARVQAHNQQRRGAVGPLRVMFPMVTNLEELLVAKRLLKEECVRYATSMPEVGIMIEVPAAALTSRTLIEACDFFSVGTNDLAQYTLAMDRGNEKLSSQVSALHPAVLQLIKITAASARDANKHVSICGGVASDPDAAAILVGLGVHELSATPMSIPKVKSVLRQTTLAQAIAAAEERLNQPQKRKINDAMTNQNFVDAEVTGGLL